MPNVPLTFREMSGGSGSNWTARRRSQFGQFRLFDMAMRMYAGTVQEGRS